MSMLQSVRQAPAGQAPAGQPGHEPPVPELITRERLAADLRALGVRSGQTLLVHASLSQIGWVETGAPTDGGRAATAKEAAATVVAALTDVLGPDGTLVVNAGTPENSLTSRSFRDQTKGLRSWHVSGYVEQMPAFDPKVTPTSAGAVAEALRTTPGAARSHHPQSSFAAVGPHARELMAGHQVTCHLGEESPLAKLYDRHASILLLGVGYGSCTAFHLAEYRYTTNPPMREYSCLVMEGGIRRWMRYRDVVLDDAEFENIGKALEDKITVTIGTVGKARSRLLPLRCVVDFATDWLKANRW
jgi:aminoglycoside 3-N-acetyltransferase